MIRPVSVEFGANGLKIRQVKRDGLVALFSVHGKSGKLYGFEVVILAVAPAVLIMGTYYRDREVYPGNEQFGQRGWYFPFREDAETRFAVLQGAANSPPLSQNVAVPTAPA